MGRLCFAWPLARPSAREQATASSGREGKPRFEGRDGDAVRVQAEPAQTFVRPAVPRGERGPAFSRDTGAISGTDWILFSARGPRTGQGGRGGATSQERRTTSR